MAKFLWEIRDYATGLVKQFLDMSKLWRERGKTLPWVIALLTLISNQFCMFVCPTCVRNFSLSFSAGFAFYIADFTTWKEHIDSFLENVISKYNYPVLSSFTLLKHPNKLSYVLKYALINHEESTTEFGSKLLYCKSDISLSLFT